MPSADWPSHASVGGWSSTGMLFIWRPGVDRAGETVDQLGGPFDDTALVVVRASFAKLSGEQSLVVTGVGPTECREGRALPLGSD